MDNALFGIIISLVAFEVGAFINKKTKLSILNPLLIAIILIIAFLMKFNISYDTYNIGGSFISMFLGPATVILAVPLYKRISLLKKNWLGIVVGITIGVVFGSISVFLIATLLGLDGTMIASLLPKSITTPVGIELSSKLQGIESITILSIVLSGIVGAVISPFLIKVFKIKSPVAKGIGIGAGAHAVGTTKAIEMGETEGAMSSLAISITAIITMLIVPYLVQLITK